ncbi:putative endoplasmic reticulum oxidoreductin 1, ERO1-like superfamily [Helianthus annuus]|uniref:Endoplasmic reticulum oxidoreductin 1, ERO1-like superfamily n=2 Tax=Helianthus annuus TaxID=4232 RepID=A0A9K3H7Z9_HELAN|nr:putative endoplasmic reticulum oxidoreductin 1, ERO1-like superfamily [Helianthus annuus]KAJ0463789.1 putative endoplasmic reticulum oxidoreductin 1, ERO1-like superfamily [Helianthus annuus]KAJ0655838.1 putative endoplasmic reticulum oxidoreductin 1, ERO1-like superfamily [Helianthus annuus]
MKKIQTFLQVPSEMKDGSPFMIKWACTVLLFMQYMVLLEVKIWFLNKLSLEQKFLLMIISNGWVDNGRRNMFFYPKNIRDPFIKIGLAPFGLSTCKRPDDCSLLYELPESFKTPSLHVIPTNDLICQEGKPEAVVDPWTNYDETYNDKILNLQLNPERYSSYSGPSARRVWDAVYSQLCPEYSSGNSCPEKKVLYRLMSGLHSSISVHIATDYLLDEKTNQVFLAWIQLHKTACYRLSCDTFV